MTGFLNLEIKRKARHNINCKLPLKKGKNTFLPTNNPYSSPQSGTSPPIMPIPCIQNVERILQ